MVAALTCAQAEPYNGFVRKFRPELATQAQQLKSFFVRTYGRRAQQVLDGFVTALANAASARTIANRAQSCTNSARLFDATLALGPKELALLAASHPAASSHGFAGCAPALQTVLGPPKRKPPRGEQTATGDAAPERLAPAS